MSDEASKSNVAVPSLLDDVGTDSDAARADRRVVAGNVSTKAEQAINTERRAMCSDMLAYFRAGDLEAAQERMDKGFARQIRLAGLGRAVKEKEDG